MAPVPITTTTIFFTSGNIWIICYLAIQTNTISMFQCHADLSNLSVIRSWLSTKKTPIGRRLPIRAPCLFSFDFSIPRSTEFFRCLHVAALPLLLYKEHLESRQWKSVIYINLTRSLPIHFHSSMGNWLEYRQGTSKWSPILAVLRLSSNQ